MAKNITVINKKFKLLNDIKYKWVRKFNKFDEEEHKDIDIDIFELAKNAICPDLKISYEDDEFSIDGELLTFVQVMTLMDDLKHAFRDIIQENLKQVKRARANVVQEKSTATKKKDTATKA